MTASSTSSVTPKSSDGIGVSRGPDLNPSRTPLDKKTYRQILLPNGLRAVLVSDTIAMHQHDGYCDDDDDASYSDDDDDNEQETIQDRGTKDNKELEGDDDDDDDDDDELEEDDGLRDAAVAVLVGVGSMYDPPEAQGLAHFLEHMLFMGTDKYPKENAFDEFISKSGGSDNAYTEMEYTVYHLEIPQEGLFKALDMMAQFFISPLMSEDAVERELNSIESEFQLSKNCDESRLLQLLCHTSGNDPGRHPFSKFSWGNLKSLKEIPEKNNVDVMKELRKFYHQYYIAPNMRLVVVGGYTLDALEERVVKHFSDVPSKPRETSLYAPQMTNHNSWSGKYRSLMADNGLPLQPLSLGKIYRIIPVKEFHCLNITWQLPSQFANWRSKPCDYISHLLGHESKGSLLSSLKLKSWATALYAGAGSQGLEDASSHTLFTLNITLSEDGVSKWQDILQEVFTYLGMIRYYCSQPNGLPEWIYKELESIQKVAYEYGDEHTAEELVEAIVEDMAPHRRLPPEHLLDGSELLFEYDGDIIKDLLDNHFTPGNTRLDLMSSTFGRASDFDDRDCIETQAKALDLQTVGEDDAFTPKSKKNEFLNIEPHFGTRFWCHSIKKETMNIWEKAALPSLPPPSSLLQLPPVNPFIPKVFDLKPLPADDSNHPLLNCSMKLCISVGKKKAWFPATVTKYNGLNNEILLSYEDEDEKWHKVDVLPSDWVGMTVAPNFESTLDNKAIKYKVVALALQGEGAVLKYGDESDFDVEDGAQFPAIPPAQSESRLPQLICNTQALKLWHLQDRKFHRPIAELRLRMTCADANKTPLESACADLFVTLFGDTITETTYLASVCELGSSISSNDVGFGMRVHGFDDKLMDLAEFSLNLFFKFRDRIGKGLPEEVKEGRFEACLEVLQRRYHNHGLQASKLASTIRLRCIRPSQWSSHAKAKALEGITVNAFVQTICTILKTISVEAFYHGNLTASDAHAAAKLISTLIKESGGGGLPKKKRPKLPVLKVPPSIEHHLITVPSKDVSDPNTAIEIYFQIGPDNLRDRVMTDLLSHILYEPLYDQLRTRDQFGYTVSTDTRWTYGVMGLHFRVVTTAKSAEETVARIDQFIVDYRKEFENMTKDQYMENLVGLAKHKLLMASSLSDECGTFWSEITDYRYDWQVKRNEVLALRSISKDDALEKYDEWLMPTCSKGQPRKRRAIGVQVIGVHGGAASLGRPDIDPGDTNDYIEQRLVEFHNRAKNATWGKIL